MATELRASTKKVAERTRRRLMPPPAAPGERRGPAEFTRRERRFFAYGLRTLRKKIARQNARIFCLRERPDVVEWAEKNLWIPFATTPGWLRLDGYQKEILRSMCDPDVKRVIVPKSVQVGYSLLVTIAILYYLVVEGAPVAYVTQSADKAKEWLKDYFHPMFAAPENTILHEIVRERDANNDKDTLQAKRFKTGGILYIRTAASDDAARSFKAKVVFADELDAVTWLPKGGKAQGDRFENFTKRMTWYADAKMVGGGSPTNKAISLVEAKYDRTDQREYFVPCPHCSGIYEAEDRDAVQLRGFQMFKRDKFLDEENGSGFVWETDPTDDSVIRASYTCQECGTLIDEIDKEGYNLKRWMDRHGEHRPLNGEWVRGDKPGKWVRVRERVDENGDTVGIPTTALPEFRGYRPWAAVAFSPQTQWKILAGEYLQAKSEGSEAMQVFHNTRLGIAYERQSAYPQIEEHALARLCVPYPGDVPEDVIFITAGVDLQRGMEDGSRRPRLEISIWGWGRRFTRFLIGHWIIEGVYSQETEAALDDLLDRAYVTPSGRELYVQGVGCDAGDQTQLVRNYIRPRMARNRFQLFTAKNETGRKHSSLVNAARQNDRGDRWNTVCSITAYEELYDALQAGNVLGGAFFPPTAKRLGAYISYFKGIAGLKVTVGEGGGVFYKRKSNQNTCEPAACYLLAAGARDLVGQMYPQFSSKNLEDTADKRDIPKELTLLQVDRNDEDKCVQASAVKAATAEIITPMAPPSRSPSKPAAMSPHAKHRAKVVGKNKRQRLRTGFPGRQR